MHEPSDYEPQWAAIRCPKCWSKGFPTSEAYGDHLLGCEGTLDWKANLTPDDITFLKVNRIDPEVDIE